MVEGCVEGHCFVLFLFFLLGFLFGGGEWGFWGGGEGLEGG